MVSIFTYRDERKLFAVAGAIIVAALLALLQLDFTHPDGRTSPLSAVITTATTWAQLAVTTVTTGTRNGFNAIVTAPQLAHDNGELRATVDRLPTENRDLTETLARVPAEARALARARSSRRAFRPASSASTRRTRCTSSRSIAARIIYRSTTA